MINTLLILFLIINRKIHKYIPPKRITKEKLLLNSTDELNTLLQEYNNRSNFQNDISRGFTINTAIIFTALTTFFAILIEKSYQSIWLVVPIIVIIFGSFEFTRVFSVKYNSIYLCYLEKRINQLFNNKQLLNWESLFFKKGMNYTGGLTYLGKVNPFTLVYGFLYLLLISIHIVSIFRAIEYLHSPLVGPNINFLSFSLEKKIIICVYKIFVIASTILLIIFRSLFQKPILKSFEKYLEEIDRSV